MRTEHVSVDAPPPRASAAADYLELVESLEDVVFRFDAGGRWTFLSPAWKKRLGYEPGECLGRAAAKFVHPLDRAGVMQRWSEVFAGQAHSYRGEVRFRDTSGGHRWMLVSARGLRDAAGRLRGVTGTLTDVTAAKTVEAELIAARSAAEAANRAKSEFLSTMSHELRTPLNAVIGLSESLLEPGLAPDPARLRRYLEIIHASGRQLLAQINDVLDLARLEAGRLQPSPTEFDLGALCAAALEAAQRDIRAKQLEAALSRPPAPLLVCADERLIRQVVQNLVSNAIKFTPRRGAIAIALSAGPAGVELAVTDTGIGIAPENLSRLFKPFSQIDSSLSREFGGTGLGLVLVNRFVRLHGGTVDVRSTLGAGSVFTVTLPASCCVSTSARPPGQARPRRVVLVDDDWNQHTLVGDFLRRRQFEVVHCEDAREALQAVAAAEPGLAIVDLNMPGMNGLELIARLRAGPHGAALPIVVASARAEAADIARCREAGATDHVAKPLSLSVLWHHVQKHTGHAS